MFSAIYLERELTEHPRARQLLGRFPQLPVIEIERYGEVFNRRAQNFRLQKQAPALIIAAKHGKLVLPTPPGYGFETGPGFYFSHMLNCLYDCRYCFLQGMYRSAHYVLFVNYEDFAAAIEDTVAESSSESSEPGEQRQVTFYSGYDCDSLALEPVSEFMAYLLPLFRRLPQAVLEIRSKSTQVRGLLEQEPLPNVVTAMSFTPPAQAERWEHKVPSIEKRLDALMRLQQAGWPVALRFEPLIASEHCAEEYGRLFEQVFSRLDAAALHSVSIGEFRMPKEFHKTIAKLYPAEPLFAAPTEEAGGLLSLKSQAGSEQLLQAIEQQLFEHIPQSVYYRCA